MCPAPPWSLIDFHWVKNESYQAAGHSEISSQPTFCPALCQQGSHSTTASTTREERANLTLSRGLENAAQALNTSFKSSKVQKSPFGYSIAVTVHNPSTLEAKVKACHEFEVLLDYIVSSRLAWVVK